MLDNFCQNLLINILMNNFSHKITILVFYYHYMYAIRLTRVIMYL